MSVKILVDIDCRLLQEIRLVQALSEGQSQIVIPSHLEDRYINLRKYLKMRYEIGDKGDLLLSKYISISHPKPLTCFGRICRPLVFPLAMVQKCVKSWCKFRTHKFMFVGIMNEHREKTISEWINKNFGVRNCRDVVNVVTHKNIFYSVAALIRPAKKQGLVI